MKFNFKIQQYQTDAVDAVAQVFNGQRKYDRVSYIRDLGKRAQQDYQLTLSIISNFLLHWLKILDVVALILRWKPVQVKPMFISRQCSS